jgi:hypothetical protein
MQTVLMLDDDIARPGELVREMALPSLKSLGDVAGTKTEVLSYTLPEHALSYIQNDSHPLPDIVVTDLVFQDMAPDDSEAGLRFLEDVVMFCESEAKPIPRLAILTNYWTNSVVQMTCTQLADWCRSEFWVDPGSLRVGEKSDVFESARSASLWAQWILRNDSRRGEVSVYEPPGTAEVDSSLWLSIASLGVEAAYEMSGFTGFLLGYRSGLKAFVDSDGGVERERSLKGFLGFLAGRLSVVDADHVH